MIDPRQPRFGQAITGTLALAAYLLDWPAILPVLAVVLAGASLGPPFNLYAHLYRLLVRPRLDPPLELEEAGPPRFANTLGFLFLTAASISYFAFDPPLAGGWLAWGLALLVSGLALLAAITGLCVGCELYVWARRLATRGRVAGKATRPVERVSA